MTPDPDARRRALEQILVNGIGAPPDVRLQPVDLAPLAPARLEQPQEGIVTTYRPVEDEEAQLRAQADEAVRFANLGEVSSRAIEGLTGARGADIWTPMRQRADEPLKAFLALQQRKEGRAAAGKAAKPPPSPADIEALHAFARARWPEEPEAIIAGITPERFESIRKTLDAKYRIKSSEELAEKGISATDERARLDREQRAQIWAEQRGLKWAQMDQDERLAVMRLADRAADREARGDKASTKEVSDLRKEFEAHQGVKDYRSSQVSIDKLRAAAKDPSAAGDLALIFSYMKILDPGSVVKETEFANAQNAAGVPDRIRNAWNKAKSGERLNTQQRADFIKSAERLFGAQETAYRELATQYEGLAPEGSAQKVVMPARPSVPGPKRTPATQALPNDASGQPTLDVPAKESKKYSKKTDTTYVFDASGQVIRTEKGDTRGRAAP